MARKWRGPATVLSGSGASKNKPSTIETESIRSKDATRSTVTKENETSLGEGTQERHAVGQVQQKEDPRGTET